MLNLLLTSSNLSALDSINFWRSRTFWYSKFFSIIWLFKLLSCCFLDSSVLYLSDIYVCSPSSNWLRWSCNCFSFLVNSLAPCFAHCSAKNCIHPFSESWLKECIVYDSFPSTDLIDNHQSSVCLLILYFLPSRQKSFHISSPLFSLKYWLFLVLLLLDSISDISFSRRDRSNFKSFIFLPISHGFFVETSTSNNLLNTAFLPSPLILGVFLSSKFTLASDNSFRDENSLMFLLLFLLWLDKKRILPFFIPRYICFSQPIETMLSLLIIVFIWSIEEIFSRGFSPIIDARSASNCFCWTSSFLISNSNCSFWFGFEIVSFIWIGLFVSALCVQFLATSISGLLYSILPSEIFIYCQALSYQSFNDKSLILFACKFFNTFWYLVLFSPLDFSIRFLQCFICHSKIISGETSIHLKLFASTNSLYSRISFILFNPSSLAPICWVSNITFHLSSDIELLSSYISGISFCETYLYQSLVLWKKPPSFSPPWNFMPFALNSAIFSGVIKSTPFLFISINNFSHNSTPFFVRDS